jgi:hypothetical protein
MAVSSAACGPTDLRWTGVETAFPAGFAAQTAGTVEVTYLPDNASMGRVTLELGMHYAAG